MDAAWWTPRDDGRVTCRLCPHGCVIAPGKRGICRVRENRDGALVPLSYGEATSIAMDPIEKKPLYHFHPGASILSVGSWGCNFRCAFCQNATISQEQAATRTLPPAEAVAMAAREDSVGIAYTYNEPLIAWEYVRDCAKAAREAGLKNVLVTNGFINPEPLEELLPWIDAMNVDVKAFHEGFYEKLCGGALAPVLATVERAARDCHVETTTLLIPEHNDAPKELENLAAWIADRVGPKTPVHLSAYRPQYRMTARATPVEILEHAREIFAKRLDFVYLGNVRGGGGAETVCHTCGATVVGRDGYAVETGGMNGDGTCAKCGAGNNIVTG